MAKPVVVTIAHELGQVEAQKRLQAGFSRLCQQFGAGVLKVEERWDGNNLEFSARALAQTITGQVEVREQDVRFEVSLPWALAVLADGLRNRLGRAGQLLLADKKAG